MEDEEQYKYDHASQMAGEYIEELGKTDMAQFTLEEWRELLHIIVEGYHTAPPF